MYSITNLHGPIQAIGTSFAGNVIYAAKVAVPIILIFLLGHSYARSMFFQEGTRMDYKPLLRGIVLMFVIAFYAEITTVVSAGITGLIQLIPQKPDVMDAIAQMAESTMSSGGDPDPSDGWFDEIVVSFEEALSFTNLVSYALQEGLLYMVRSGVSLVRSMLLAFLYITGPIALVLSMLPGMHNSGLAWLKGFVGVQFWELSIRILDNLVFQYNLYAQANYALSDTGYVIGVNLVALLMYLLIPSMTNYFLNTGAAGGFMSRIAQTGAGVVFMSRSFLQRAGSAGRSRAVQKAHQQANRPPAPPANSTSKS
ncbi:MAG: hypothetical protein AAFP02_03490 [Bacteroidota bacterium]